MALLVKLKNALLGWTKITVSSDIAPLIARICIEKQLSYEKMKFFDGKIYFKMPPGDAKKLIQKLSDSNIPFESIKGGLPSFFSRYRKRYGLMAGTILAILIMYFSGTIVWDIRVSGNSSLTASQIIAELGSVGFRKGSPIGKRDVDEITNALLIKSEGLAWMSINMHGNVAYVDVVEKMSAEGEFGKDLKGKANIIAARDGVIENIEVFRGSAAVSIGQSVKEGELLISGISENPHGEYRTEHALGKVYAVTNRSFSVKIPLVYEKKILSEPVCTKKTVKFFSKYINIFRNYGNLGANCVKIEEENSFSLFGLPELPFSIISEMTMEYENVNGKRSHQQASELAFFELEKLMEAELYDAELLEKNITTEFTDDFFLLDCKIICLENIAITIPIGEGKE